MNRPNTVVENYISAAPRDARAKLRQVRAAIRSAAPEAVESIGYGMPAYDKGRVGWFSARKDYIGVYVRPPIIVEHKKELARYKTTKSAIHFPLAERIPVALIKKPIKARIKKNRSQFR
jgi:uncharacterized protein YdhG (YjbR/CyaY superfamily)